MKTISISELEVVHGGIRGQSSEQIADRRRNLCFAPNPTEARRHYDEMVKRMPTGVWPRTIKAVGELCGWPVPEGARNARPVPGAAT
jgi:hypothetical protein